jgi:ribosomal protein S27AE
MDERFCPNCGSTHVEPDTSNRWATATFGGNPNEWFCKECGYSGLMPSGDPEEDFEEGSEDINFEPDEKYNRIDIEATPKFAILFSAIVAAASVLYAALLIL